MSKMTKRSFIAFTLVLTMVCSLAFQYQVKAGGGYDFVENLVQGIESDGTVTPGKTLSIQVADLEKSCSGFKKGYDAGQIKVYWDVNGERLTPTYDSGVFTQKVRYEDAGKSYCFFVLGSYQGENYNNNTRSYPVNANPYAKEESKGSIDISIDSKGIATVTGTLTAGDATFKYVWVDNKNRFEVSGKSFKKTIDTKNFDIGYHELSAELTDGTEIQYPKVFPTAIYEKPALKITNFETYPKKLIFTTPNYNGYKYDYYLQVKKAGEKWDKAKLYGSFDSYVPKVINSLKPGTKYVFRAVYTKKTKYGGKEYYFAGPKSGEVTVKTGPKAKPPIQSIRISKAVTSKHWVKPKYEGLKLVAEGFWVTDTTYTVTIKMKKKPGVAGIYVHSSSNSPLYQYIKGNKKVYKCKFRVGGKAIGKNATVQVYAKGNKTYGCYSPTYKKKVKIKR